MERRKTLRVDLEELCSAMEDTSYEHRYYLDLETGEIIFFSDDDDAETGELKNRIDNEPEVFEAIPRIESSQAYSDMEDFIASVKADNVAGLLGVAIQGKGAFRRFKNVLLDFSEERERWFRFKEARMRDRAAEWLDEIGVKLFRTLKRDGSPTTWLCDSLNGVSGQRRGANLLAA